jgi:acetolactate synthase-1/2/3 large subunit
MPLLAEVVPVSARSLERIPAVHALLAVLEEEGVEVVFGVPGGPLTALFEALQARSTIRFVMAKHEGGAAFMAASYARVSGKLGVCVGTSGPGATNALTGVASAQADSLPLLFLSGQVSTTAFGTGAIQESSAFGIDLVRLFEPVTKLSVMFPSVERVPDTVRHALRVALGGRQGAVHLNMPANMLQAEIDYRPLRSHEFRAHSRTFDVGALGALAEAFGRARSPCILAGHGVGLSRAENELLALAYRAGAHVVTTPKGKGAIAETEPLWAGVHGFGGHVGAETTLADADLLLIIGSSLNEFVTNGRPLGISSECVVAQIDIDPGSIGRNQPVDVSVVGDARAVLEALEERLSRKPRAESASRPPRSVAPVPVKAESGFPAAISSAVKPRELVLALRQAMADEDLLFVDIGTAILWSVHHFQVRRPHTFFVDLGLGSMGAAVAGSVGGALAAAGSARVVALVGDGALAMNGMELHTAAEYGIAVTWVVLNNSGHGMVRQGDQIMRGRDLGASRFQRPFDAAQIARGLGVPGFRAESLEELRPLLSASLASNGPSLIDVNVALDETPPTLRRRVETLARYMGKR